jgi:cytochrome c oxidase subunit 3
MAAETTALTASDAHATTGHSSGGIGNPVLGMLLFITSEVMFFAGLFAAYFSIRANFTETIDGVVVHHWPPQALEDILNPFRLVTPEGYLNVVLPATIMLVISSFTCQFAVNAIKHDNRTSFVRNLSVTLILGIAFLLLQLFDYSVLIREGLTISNTTFGTTYYTLTGFHFAHVFGGVLMLGVVLYRGMAGQFNSRHHDMVEASSLYWHFVDIVWVLLFSILYLL